MSTARLVQSWCGRTEQSLEDLPGALVMYSLREIAGPRPIRHPRGKLSLACLCLLAATQGLGRCAEPRADQEQLRAAATVEDTMRIHFTRSGGFAGLQLSVSVASDTLPEQDVAELRRLIDESDFFVLPAVLGDSAAADQFLYKVTVEQAAQQHTVEVTEDATPAALQPLLDWLTRAARRARRDPDA